MRSQYNKWLSPVDLIKHLDDHFDKPKMACQYSPWLHKITAVYLKHYYKEFFPSPYDSSKSIGYNYINVIGRNLLSNRKRLKSSLKCFKEYNIDFDHDSIDLN